MMEPNGPPASAFETAAIEPRKIAPTAAQCFMPAPAKTRQYYCELQSECKVSFCSQQVWGPKNGEPPERYAFFALPERGVTFHSGDMGYTIGPFAGSAKCPGRCVNLWTND